MQLKQQEQIAEILYDLSTELGGQLRFTERPLMRSESPWTTLPVDTEAMLRELNGITENIRKHRGLVWLRKQPNFNDAIQFFDEEIGRVEESEFETNRMRLRLIKIISGSGWQLLDESSWVPPTISKKDKDRAADIASELLTFVSNTTGRPDHPTMQALEGPLTRFIVMMKSKTKREYKGQDYRNEQIAINFAYRTRNFKLKKGKIVELLEMTFSIFDVDLGHRTAQNYVNRGLARSLSLLVLVRKRIELFLRDSVRAAR